MSMISTSFSTFSPLPLSFFLTRSFVMASCSTVSFWANDLVKSLLALVSTTIVVEGKCNFIPFFTVVLAEGTSSSSGAG
jgi:hypothetical protein